MTGRTGLAFWVVVTGGCNLVIPLGTARDQSVSDAAVDHLDKGGDGSPSWDGVPDQDQLADVGPACVTDQDCNDSLACTKDQCTTGVCKNPVDPGWCLIGKTCVQDGQPSPASVCRRCDTAASTTSWSDAPEGEMCDDGLTCTQPDACFHGACLGEVDPGFCVVGPPGQQACHKAGDVDPNDSCGACDPTFHTHAWTPLDGCVLTLAGDGSNTVLDGYLLTAKLSEPTGMQVAGGRIFVAGNDGHVIRLIERSLVTTYAGCG